MMELERVFDNACARDWETVDPSDLDPVRVAVIGLGWFTRGRALPALQQSDYCEPTLLVSGDETKAARLAEECGGETRGIDYKAFHDGVARDAYDAVYICTPNALHLDYAETAAAFGKDVLCEKPLERDSERAKQLVAVCADADVRLMVAYRMHTEPAIRRARELIHDGFVGEPQDLHGAMSQRLLDRIDDNPNQWRLNEELAGGGALFDLGVYPLNTARFLLDSDPVAVSGHTRASHDAFSEVDETASFSVRFPGEVTLSAFVSHNARQASEIRVTGTEGEIRVSPAFFQDQRRVLHLSRGDSRASIEIDPVDQLLEEFDYFAHQLHIGEAFTGHGEHGLTDMCTMEAVYAAEQAESWLDL